MCFLFVHILTAQEIPVFEIIDNQSIGLTAAPFEKAGLAIADIDNNG